MKLFDAEGDYDVMIVGPYWEQSGKDGEMKMAAVLPGLAVINGEERGAYGHLYFSEKLIASGRNAGRTMADVNMETLLQLGMPAPFNPTEIGVLEGMPARFVCAFEEYEGKTSLKVKFVNPPGRAALADAEVLEIWAAIKPDGAEVVGTVPATVPAAPAAGIDPDDDLPF